MKIVKKLMSLSAVFMIVSVLAVSACGGKKSAATSDPTTASLSSVVPASAATNVTANTPVVFTLAVNNATSSDGSQLSYQCNSATVLFTPASALTGNTMTVTLTPTATAQIFTVIPCTVSGNITTTGPGGSVTTAINLSFSEAPTTFSYTDKVYTLYGTAQYPYMVTPGGVIPVANMTGITAGTSPLSYCALYAKPIDNGIIPVLCVDNKGENHFLYIDPSTNELWVYTGPTVLGQAYSVDWLQVPWGTIEYAPAAPLYDLVAGAYAIIPTGVFFIENTPNNTTLKFAQNMNFSNIMTVPVSVAVTTTSTGTCDSSLGNCTSGASSTTGIFGVIIGYSN
jgi:hypothetical protein